MPKAAGFPPKRGGARLLAGAHGVERTVPHPLDLTRSSGTVGAPPECWPVAHGGRPIDTPHRAPAGSFLLISPRLGS